MIQTVIQVGRVGTQVAQVAQDNLGILVDQAATLVVEVAQADTLVVVLAAVDGCHPSKVHLGLILCSQLVPHQTTATEEKSESFCADFHFSSNNMVHFFVRPINDLSIFFCQ